MGGPHFLAWRLKIARSTIYAVLRRYGLSRLNTRTCKPAVRYEWPEPGDMVHLDVKKLGRIPDGGGWRVHGRPGYRKDGGGWEHRPQTNGKADPFLRESNLFRPHEGIGGQPPISRAN